MSPKARTFWPMLLIFLVTDCASKDYAVEQLATGPRSHAVIDSFLRFTLVYNPGTAFGFDLRPYIGAWARPVLIGAMAAVLLFLARMYWHAAPRGRLVGAALALACGGAIGNLLDRLRFASGVVDFIDVGLGSHRFWIFNVADAGITVGTGILAFTLLRAGQSHDASSTISPSTPRAL